MNKEIREYFCSRKVSKVKKATVGPKTNIWKAVKLAKDLCLPDIPTYLTVGGIPVTAGTFAVSFATYFHNTVTCNMAKVKVNS